MNRQIIVKDPIAHMRDETFASVELKVKNAPILKRNIPIKPSIPKNDVTL